MKKYKKDGVSARYLKIFGEIRSLSDQMHWTMGISNMFEWLIWDTKSVLGISKTKLRNRVVEMCTADDLAGCDPAHVQKVIEKRFAEETKASEQPGRYSPTKGGMLTPREALRQVKYFSEVYLNKEFDIFWLLSSDKFLDAVYEPHFKMPVGGQWSSHGGCGLFEHSTGIVQTQPDSLSYNTTHNVLIGNELKLGGKKNRDQILKYAWMYKELESRGFVSPGCKFGLFFLSDSTFSSGWNELIDKEIEHCRSAKNKEYLLSDETIEVARTMAIAETTWTVLAQLCETYAANISEEAQVEQKLLAGFIDALNAKNFMQA